MVGGLPNHCLREVERNSDKSASWPDCVKPPDKASIAFHSALREGFASTQWPNDRDRLSRNSVSESQFLSLFFALSRLILELWVRQLALTADNRITVNEIYLMHGKRTVLILT